MPTPRAITPCHCCTPLL